jgi:hypothetical protein
MNDREGRQSCLGCLFAPFFVAWALVMMAWIWLEEAWFG